MHCYIRVFPSQSHVFNQGSSFLRYLRSRFNVALMLQQAICLVLVTSLFASSTPAATTTVVELSQKWPAELGFWLRANDIWPGLLYLIQWQRGVAKPQEKQVERDARVTHLRILPGDVTVQEGQQVSFNAIAYDVDDNPVSGVKFSWTAVDENRGRHTRISPRGDFKATVTGNFKLTVAGAGRQSSVKVRVLEGRRKHKNDDQPLDSRTVSTRDLPAPFQAANAKSRTEVGSSTANKGGNNTLVNKSRLAHVNTKRKPASNFAPEPTPFFLDDGWGNTNYLSADDPENRLGNPAGAPLDEGAGSGNFQFAAPVLSLPGRGININLRLAYNSRVWNKAGGSINFDIDRDWPAPGWSLGFGKLLGMGVWNGSMLVDADGTRHSYGGTVTNYGWGTYFAGHTTDGTFIDYWHWTGTGGVMLSAGAKFANGTVIEYNAQGAGGLYPTRITDANGNYITITYVNNTGPRIQTVSDTLGRTITFHYDSNNRLTAVTAPGLNSGSRTLVRLHYSQLSLSYSFSGLTAITRESAPWVIDAIYYPGTGTGYWFNQSDNAYSSYGMLKKVSERRGMTFTGSDPVPPGQGPTDQGSISSGSITREEIYSYPLNTSDTGGSNLTDAPTYASCTESWTRDGSSTMDQATTFYEVHQNASPRTVTVTLPNNTTSTQYSYNAPGSYLDGLIFKDETKSGSNLLQQSTTEWEQGDYGSPRATVVKATNERSLTKQTTLIYGSPGTYNQVIEARSYDYGDTNPSLLKSTHTQYQNSGNYTSRHIFNLPLVVEVYAANNITRVSKTDFQYDGQTLNNTPGVIMHDDASNPYYEPVLMSGDCYYDCSNTPPGEPCEYVCDPDWWYNAYVPATDYRGNLTQITTYSDAANASGAIAETRRYDITGNLLSASTSCCEQTSYIYDASTYYAYPLAKLRGSATDALNQIRTTDTYDFNTGRPLSSTDANGQPAQVVYDPSTLRPQTATLPTGAHTDYLYDDAGLSITETTYLQTHPTHTAIGNQSVMLLNGRGQVRQEKALGENNVWDFVDTVYNSMGQASQQSLPYRSGDTIQWSTSSYDALGRVISSQAPDGSTSQSFYNEISRPSAASSTSGETVKMTDPWGRERWARNDALGRLVEVVEPDPNGGGSVASNGMVTAYQYDTLGNLITVTQGSQTRSFKYDSLSRLIAQKLAEKSATLDNSGNYVGIGGSGAQWTDFFRYDLWSNVVQHRDARGVKTNFWYFDRANHNDPGDGTSPDPLGRLQSVTYDSSSDPNHGLTINDQNYYLKVLDAAAVNYQYRTKSIGSDSIDIMQPLNIVTEQVSSENFHYDSFGRVDIKTLTLNGRSSAFVTNYDYDALDRTTDVTYPAEYGNGSALRKVVHQNYDVASRLSSLTFNGQSQASNIVYNALSQTTSLNIGVSGTNQITESYGYSPQTGLLESQTVTRNGASLLNLSYDYTNVSGKRTGQLVKLLNNNDHTKDRGYEYDTLGRLKRATGGQNVRWTQRYTYDRYGNRNNVYSYTAESYIKNFYLTALNRAATTTEVQSWLTTLQSAYAQGPSQFLSAMQSLGTSVFTSQEYLNRNRDNHWYVYDLYKAYLWRDPDSGGWSAWEAAVSTYGRDAVRNGFAGSTEFGLKVSGTSPYSPSPGTSAPRDGWEALSVDSTSNRIADSGWSYDAAGNQIRTATGPSTWQVFQYDAANRLVRVLADDKISVIASHTYGSSNQRLSSSDPNYNNGQGLRTYYVTDGGSVISEYSELGSATTPTWSKSYVYLGDRLLSTLTPNGSGGDNTEYHHPDRLGTRLVTNAQNTNYSEQVTMPFGTAFDLESGSTVTNRRFTSYDRSTPTGLDYAVNRHYDAQQGRFTQVDPIGMESTSLDNPQTLNLYTYCVDDPLNNVDPSGLGFVSFFKGLFKAIGKVLTNKWVLLAVGIAVGAVAGLAFVWAFVKAGIVLAGTSAALIVAAFHPVVQRVAMIAGSIASAGQGVIGAMNAGTMSTPPWNPSSGVGPIAHFVQTGYSDPDIDPKDIVRIYTRAPKWLTRVRDFLAGVIDNGVGGPPILGWSLGRVFRLAVDRAAGNYANEDSWSYTIGSWAPDALAAVTTGGVATEERIGIEGTEWVRDRLFRWGRGSFKVRGQWVRNKLHFHVGPDGGLMKHHLPYEWKTWYYHARSRVKSLFR